jgi:hypothetical protein
MRTGKVIALNLGGRGNKIFKSGDSVKESNFPDGNFDRLIKEGFIREDLPEPVKSVLKQETPAAKPAEELVAEKAETAEPELNPGEVDLGFGTKNNGSSKNKKR